MKRTPIKRKTPLARKPMRRRPKAERGKYANRPRAPQAWWDFVRSLRCAIPLFGAPTRRGTREAGIVLLALPCSGPVEANHVGERIAGLGTKALDRTAVPHCKEHHRQWTEYDGLFAGMTHGERREYADIVVEHVHNEAWLRGVEVPDC